MQKNVFFGAVGACVLLSVSSALGATITNGSFEQPGTGFRTVQPGQTWGNWTCSGPNGIEFVDINGNASLPGLSQSGYDGNYWIDLTGVGAPSGIYQDVATVSGQQYRIDFAMAGNIWSGAQLMRLRVNWNGAEVGLFEHNTAGHTGANFGWTLRSVFVTGTGGADRLEFRGLTGSAAAGVALDAVSIHDVPAPAGAAVIVAGSLLGLRRRRGSW